MKKLKCPITVLSVFVLISLASGSRAALVTYSASAPASNVEVFHDPSAGDLSAYAGTPHPTGVRGISDSNKNENIGQTFTTGASAFTLDAITLRLQQKDSVNAQEYFINFYTVASAASFPAGPGGTDQRISSSTFTLEQSQVNNYFTIDVEDASLTANSTYMFVIGAHTASGTAWTRFTTDTNIVGDYTGGSMTGTIEPGSQSTSRIDDLPSGGFQTIDAVFYVQSIPEPSSLLLVGLAGLTVLAIRRRSR